MDKAKGKHLTMMDIIHDFKTDFPALKDKVYFVTGTDREDGPGTPKSISDRVWLENRGPHLLISEMDDLTRWCNGIEKRMGDGPAARGSSWGVAVVTGFNETGFNDTTQKVFAKATSYGGMLGRMIDDEAARKFGDMRATYDLASLAEHEIGHVLTRLRLSEEKTGQSFSEEEKGRNTYVEAAADAYAMIRHVERFGADTGYLEYLKELRTRRIIFSGGVGHYTAGAIDMLIDMRDAGLLTQPRTPEERVQLAIAVAGNSILSQQYGSELTSAFIETRKIEDGGAAQTPLATVRLIKDIAVASRSLAVMAAAEMHLKMAAQAVPDSDADMKHAVRTAHEIVFLGKQALQGSQPSAPAIQTAQLKSPAL